MTTLEARTPCCSRKVRDFPFLVHATDQYRRTCPSCGVRYRVLVRPVSKASAPGFYVHALEWAPEQESAS